MINKRRNILLLIIGLSLAIIAFLSKDKLSCFKINYQLQHSDIVLVKTDSTQYFEQFKNTENLQKIKLSLFEFGGQGCKPCMRMDTVLTEIKSIYGDALNLKIVRVTSRENRKIAKYFGVRMIPVQVILNTDGEEVFRHIGFLSKEELQEEIELILKTGKK
ncbi:MAG: hypothetical protein DRI84_03855 [Bacteroidetes bacterium]|nr:MAG: hypothetical protein DRI84_03855 [Bacteroidota bacterium]